MLVLNTLEKLVFNITYFSFYRSICFKSIFKTQVNFLEDHQREFHPDVVDVRNSFLVVLNFLCIGFSLLKTVTRMESKAPGEVLRTR